MKQFDERLLTELKSVVAQNAPARVPKRRPRWALRLAPVAGLAAAITAVLTLGGPTVGGINPASAAYAVTDNGDGTVTVKVYSIQDAKGLERQIEEKAGIPASVHYLPQDKLCAPPWYDDRMAGRPHKGDLGPEDPMWHQLRGRVRVSEADDGAFVFTIHDPDTVPEGWSLVVYAEDDIPEHGQPGPTVASIAPGFEKGENLDDCRLIDGSIEGWGFQQGERPTTDEQKQKDFAEYKRQHPETDHGK